MTFLPCASKGEILVYQFGEFELDPGEFRLARSGVPLPLDPKSMHVLHHLLAHPGLLVRKQELLDCIWPDTSVTENALTRVVASLRKTLEDDSRTPRYIETVPTLGYRFIAAVSVLSPPLPPEASPTAHLPVPSPAPEPLALPPAPNPSAILTRRTLLWATAALASTGSLAWLTRRKNVLPPAMSVAIPLADGATAADVGHLLGAPVIAPDGSAIVVSLSTPSGSCLFRRPLNASHMVRIDGTQYASLPFWSPDSQHIGFFAEGKLKRMPAFGGSALTLCDVLEPRGGCWGGDTILFAANLRSLSRIAANGGTPQPVTTLDTAAGENSHRFPVFLPDANRFLYFSRTSSRDNRGIYLESLDRKHPRRRVLVADGQFALGAVPDARTYFLITQQAGKMIAQRFNCDTGQAFGLEHILLDHAGQVSASDTGALALRTDEQFRSTLTWRDRVGRPLGALGQPDDYWQAALSPGGRFLAIVRHDALTGVFRAWTATLPDGQFEVLSDTDHVDSIAWAHDGATLYYIDFVQKKLFRRTVEPRGPEEFVHAVAPGDNLRGLSPDARTLIVERSRDGVRSVIEWATLDPLDRHLVDANGFLGDTSLSPDGRSLAFGSDRSGKRQVYLADFPSLENLRRISPGGGSCPRWRRDGRELFFLADDETLMSLDLSNSRKSSLSLLARPAALFRTALVHGARNPLYDITADGSRFLLVERSSSASEGDVELLLNWPSLLPA